MVADLVASKREQARVWILNPAFDLLLVCGGLFWLLICIHALLGNSRVAEFLSYEGLLLSAGLVIFSNPHTAATLFRLYSDKKTRDRFWFYGYASLVFFSVLLIACIMNSTVLALALLLYFAFLIDHTISQNYGVTIMYCFRSGYQIHGKEKLLLKLTYQALTWFAILRQFTTPGVLRPCSLYYKNFSENASRASLKL